MTLGQIVDHAIAGDMFEGVGLVHIARLGADDDAQLDFPIGLDGILGDDHIVIGTDNGAGGLHEQDRLLGDGRPGLGGVIGVVEADADELADIGNAGADAVVAVQLRQGAEVCGGDIGQACRAQGGAADVVDDARQVADGTVFSEDGGLFCALGADTKQFHGFGPYAVGKPIAADMLVCRGPLWANRFG